MNQVDTNQLVTANNTGIPAAPINDGGYSSIDANFRKNVDLLGFNSINKVNPREGRESETKLLSEDNK